MRCSPPQYLHSIPWRGQRLFQWDAESHIIQPYAVLPPPLPPPAASATCFGARAHCIFVGGADPWCAWSNFLARARLRRRFRCHEGLLSRGIFPAGRRHGDRAWGYPAGKPTGERVRQTDPPQAATKAAAKQATLLLAAHPQKKTAVRALTAKPKTYNTHNEDLCSYP